MSAVRREPGIRRRRFTVAPRRFVPSTLITLLAVALGACRSAGTPGTPTEHAAVHTLRKCTILLPLAYNDSTPIPPTVLTNIQDRLYDRFGGYTVVGRVTGAYRTDDGTRVNDESLVVWVAVPAERIDELRREAARICHVLRQESLYFEVSDAAVELVDPSER
jgi:hypothetical protein